MERRANQAMSQASFSYAHGSWLSRIIAAAMLAILLPAAVLAGPMRHCMAPDGHQKIEFLHPWDVRHASRYEGRPEGRQHFETTGHPHIEDQPCVDRALLAKAAGLLEKRPKATGPHLCSKPFAVWSFTWKHANGAWTDVTPSRARLRHDFVDPRLADLRTVVLLN